MKAAHIVLTTLLSAVVAFGVASYVDSKHENSGTASTTESAYDRVLRTGVLRCGYADWPPFMFVKDPTTGKFSGIMVDVTEAVAAKLKVKVEWTESEGWGSFIESLKAHKIDAFCPGVWRNGERGRYVAFSIPVFYSALYPYVGVDDHRFDKDLSLINDPSVRISAMDGEMSDVVAKEHFPKATEVSVPQMGQISDILINVATHKADVVFSETQFTNDYMKANPGKIRRLQDTPFEFFPTSIAVDIHETQLHDMIDNALAELHNQGVIEEILKKYNADPAVYLRVAKPYLIEQKTP